MRKLALAVLVLAAVITGGLLLVNRPRGEAVSAEAVLLPIITTDLAGYDRAIGPYHWLFPKDYGPHPAFQTEWWYYTGNLATASGRRFGYQFTVFRRTVAPTAPASDSEWRTNQLYMAHFAITDVETQQFFQAQRFSRGGAGLAGATTDPQYHVWVEDWAVGALDGTARLTHITAANGPVALDLQLQQIKPPALQGDNGLSPKSAVPGNASYYYSLSRLITTGTVTVDGHTYAASGTSWMDHEFSTSALGSDTQGWDWFGLHLDDNRELMVGRIRRADGGHEPAFSGLLVLPDGRTKGLKSDDFTIDVTDTWTSPHTGATYPARWNITIDVGETQPLRLTLEPLVSDQELLEGIVYWEGAVRITGDVPGYGYAELTGYHGTMRNRF
jgi:predicted secreted hydrolase